jgi:hypothetical protein
MGNSLGYKTDRIVIDSRQHLILQNIWNLCPPLSVEVNMSPIPAQSTLLPTIRNASRLAGDTSKKLEPGPEYEQVNELVAMRHHQWWHHDCTKMLDFL